MTAARNQIRRQALGPDGYMIVQKGSGRIEVRHRAQWVQAGDVLEHLRRVNQLARLKLPQGNGPCSEHTTRSLGSTIISVLNARAMA